MNRVCGDSVEKGGFCSLRRGEMRRGRTGSHLIQLLHQIALVLCPGEVVTAV